MFEKKEKGPSLFPFEKDQQSHKSFSALTIDQVTLCNFQAGS